MKNCAKRILSWILFVSLTLTLIPQTYVFANSAAETDPTIQIEEVIASPGSTVEVDASLANNPGVYSVEFQAKFNSEYLTLTNVEYNTSFGGTGMAPPLSSTFSISWYNNLAVENVHTNGVLATFTFDVSDNAPDNTLIEIVIVPTSVECYNADDNEVVFATVNGGINVKRAVPGDINGDRKVTTRDVTRLHQHVVGWEVVVDEKAVDVNGDQKITTRDVTRLHQYVVGWDVEIYYDGESNKCDHIMTATPAVDATCTEKGNIAYWYCSECEKYFSDENGTKEISLEDTVIEIKHVVVVDPAVAPTYTTTGLTEGSHCALCKKVIVAQEIVPVLTYEYSITYNIAGSDSYLAAQSIDNSSNPTGYDSEVGTANLINLTAPAGYTFLGWYDAPQENTSATQVRKIAAGSIGNETLYAHWQEIKYDITYKLYQTPLGAISDEKYLTYTVSKGLVDLPNPELYNYVFLGWYTDDGVEMSEIPIGTTGDITLNAYWTSKRNLTKAVKSLDDPIVIENSKEGAIYFAYEIGTIENVPLSDAIWTIQSVSGLAQQQEKTVTVETSETQATAIAETISDTTVDSSTWTLSKDWNEVTEVSEQWAEENGMSIVEANEKTKSSSGTFSFTSSNGGCDTTTTTDGTTTVDYKSQNYTHGNGAEFNAKIQANYTSELNAGVKIDGIGEIGGSKKFEIGGEIGGGYEQHQETNEHTGTDTTTVDTTVDTGTTTWNSSSSSSQTKTQSESESVSKALSSIISNTKGYGQSYSSGGENSESQGFSSTNSKSVNSSSTLTYSTAKSEKTTKTYSTDGKSEGCYRLVIAGKVHVFAVVGYDVATKSYFTYTYNVVDDETYEFLDYSPTLSFDDYENGVLPFEVPYEVYEYVSQKIVSTSGLLYRTDTINKTATVIGYQGTDVDVTIPSYFSASNTSYKVTGLSETAFAGKNVRSVILSDYIKEIPAGAFKNCTSLEEISGYFTTIGDNAFSGCTALDKFNVSPGITKIGEKAFENIDELYINALDAKSALAAAQADNPELDSVEDVDELQSIAQTITQNVIDAAINSGAQNIVLDISNITEGTALTINVPEIASFELHGGQKVYDDLKIDSKAKTTVLKEITIHNYTRIPLNISSETLKLDASSIEGTGFVLLLSATSPKISLTRDNRLISLEKEAIVWSNPTIDAEVVDNTLGVLDVIGNVYVHGNITGVANMNITDGEVIQISEDDFKNYIKGVYTITFDANGGNVEPTDMTVFYGSAFGSLPTPTLDYHTFDGWFTSNGTEVTADTVMTEARDITLTAHWTQNDASDWVLVSEVPADAQITNTKWSYTLREYTSGMSSSLSGWTHYNTARTGWSAWSGWSTYNPANGVRNVESRSVYDHTEYHYYRWTNSTHSSIYTYKTSSYGSTILEETWFTYELPTSSLGDPIRYNGSDTWANRWVRANYAGNYSVDTTFTRSINRTEWRYQDPVYTYYFYRDLSKEATTDPTGQSNVSNVQKWVQYRAK